jgi:hypothetical protein
MKTASERSGRTRAHQRIFGQPGNVMFSTFHDIIAESTAAQRFAVSALLVTFAKCHETCGCVTFREICVVCPAT